MEVIISAHKMELTDALKEHVEKKLGKVSKFSDKFYLAEIHLNKEKHRNHVQANIKGLSKPLMAETEDPESMYRAIDLCVEKLEKQLRRDKDNHGREKTSKESHRSQQLNPTLE